jgi:hypothetical protein
MIFYVKFDPVTKSIVDYSSEFDENLHFGYLKIDLNKDYGNDLAYINHYYKTGGLAYGNYRPSSISILVKEIQRSLLEKIRNDKLDYLIK